MANEVGVLQRQQHPPFTGPVDAAPGAMLLRLCEEASPLPGRTWLLPRWSRLGLGYHPIGVMTVQLRPGNSDIDEEPGLTESERAELQRLRAENAASGGAPSWPAC